MVPHVRRIDPVRRKPRVDDRAYHPGGATSRRTSVPGPHATGPVEAKGPRLEVVVQETHAMTTDKARKRAVRSRMHKTGERYAAARRHVVGDAAAPTTQLPPRVAEPKMSDATITKGTGRSWDDWFGLLDAWDATTKGHPAIARYLHDEHGVDGWWAQSVTVGYEWARGLRQVHETPDGFQVSVTRTIAASADDVWRDFVEPARRNRWLALGALRVRAGTGTRGKSARFNDPDGRLVHIYLTSKGATSSVAVTTERLAGPDEVEGHRALWRARLDDLAHRWSDRTRVAPSERRAS
jgi:hypothetical protein